MGRRWEGRVEEGLGKNSLHQRPSTKSTWKLTTLMAY